MVSIMKKLRCEINPEEREGMENIVSPVRTTLRRFGHGHTAAAHLHGRLKVFLCALTAVFFALPLDNPRMPPQLEKNHVVPTAWPDEALARDGVSILWHCLSLRLE